MNINIIIISNTNQTAHSKKKQDSVFQIFYDRDPEHGILDAWWPSGQKPNLSVPLFSFINIILIW